MSSTTAHPVSVPVPKRPSPSSMDTITPSSSHLPQPDIDTLWFPDSPPLPSPPDSPYSAASDSSLPSVTSSFFFSSAAASPPHPPSTGEGGAEGLIIPSLTLPEALRRPTTYGKTLGEVRLLVVGRNARGVAEGMVDVERYEEIVEVGGWDNEGGCVRASTDWIEHLDAHGLEKYEPVRNVEVRAVEVGEDEEDDVIQDHITLLKSYIHHPFRAISDVLHPSSPPSAILANLLSSPTTPLYTALILLVDNPPTLQQTTLHTSLAPEIPIITLPSCPPSEHNLFHAPERITHLRTEAADKFLKWREVQRALALLPSSPSSSSSLSSGHGGKEEEKWDKQKWELEYIHTLSLDVARARRARSTTITPSNALTVSLPCVDPLHLPSLLLFSLSLFGPLKKRIVRAFGETWELVNGRVGVLVVGGVVLGFGVGRWGR